MSKDVHNRQSYICMIQFQSDANLICKLTPEVCYGFTGSQSRFTLKLQRVEMHSQNSKANFKKFYNSIEMNRFGWTKKLKNICVRDCIKYG